MNNHHPRRFMWALHRLGVVELTAKTNYCRDLLQLHNDLKWNKTDSNNIQ